MPRRWLGTFSRSERPRSVPGRWLRCPMPSGFIAGMGGPTSENRMSTRSTAVLVWVLLEALGEHPELRRELAAMLRDDQAIESAAGFIESPAAARRVRLHPDTLVRFAREGRVPRACKAGRGWRFPADIGPADIVAARGEHLRVLAPSSPRRASATARPSSFAAISGRS